MLLDTKTEEKYQNKTNSRDVDKSGEDAAMRPLMAGRGLRICCWHKKNHNMEETCGIAFVYRSGYGGRVRPIVLPLSREKLFSSGLCDACSTRFRKESGLEETRA